MHARVPKRMASGIGLDLVPFEGREEPRRDDNDMPLPADRHRDGLGIIGDSQFHVRKGFEPADEGEVVHKPLLLRPRGPRGNRPEEPLCSPPPDDEADDPAQREARQDRTPRRERHTPRLVGNGR